MRLALLGFKPRERAGFEAFFKLAHKRTPAYVLVQDLRQAEFVIVDADDQAERVRAAGLDGAQRFAAVGAQPLPGAAFQTARPFNVLRIISRLDRLRGHAAGLAPPAPAAPPKNGDDAAPMEEAVPTVAMPLSSDMAPTLPMALDEHPAAVAPLPQPLQPANSPQPAKPPQTAQEPQSMLPMLPAGERISLIGLDGGPDDGLDYAPPPAADPAPAAEPAPAAGPAGRHRVKHVLVVDHGDDAVRLLVAELEPLGFSVRRARDATEALEAVRARRLHHVFLRVGSAREAGAVTRQPMRLVSQLRLAARDAGRQPPAIAVFGTHESLVGALTGNPQGFAHVQAALSLPLQSDEVLELVGGPSLQRQTFSATAPRTTYS
jgi:CheY-like chemotaxis protein